MTTSTPAAFLRLLLLSTALFPLATFAQETTPLDPITVEGADADGPVEGYIAGSTRSSTKTAMPLRRVAQTVNVVPALQIEDQGAESVAQALRYTPGVFTEYRGSSNLHDEMYMRGFGYVPRFLDGLSFGLNSFGQIDPFLLERIEAVKGPSSVLYGQANPGGLVNLTTKKPTGQRIRRLIIASGSHDRAEMGFDSGDRLSDTLDWRMAGTAWRVDTQEKGLEQERLSFAPSLRWRPTDETTLTVSAIYQTEPEAGYRNFRERIGTLDPIVDGVRAGDFVPGDFLVSDPDFQKSTRETRSLAAELEHRIGSDTVLRAKLRATGIDTEYRTLTWGALADDGVTISRTASGGTDDLRQAGADVGVEHRLDLGGTQHTILAGVDWQKTRRDYAWAYDFDVPSIDWTNPVYGVSGLSLTDRPSDTRTDIRQTGLYLQDQISWGSWDASFGLRFDDFSTEITDNLAGSSETFEDTAITGRAGLLYTFANGIAPYVGYSTSFEPVTDSSGTSTPFDPTEAEQVEVGVKWASSDGRLFAQAAVFDLTQSGVIVYDPVTFEPSQIGEIESRGFEIEGRADLGSGWSLIGSYAYLDAEVTDTVRPAELGKMPARLPKNLASLWAHYKSQNGWNAGLGLRYLGESWGDAANSFDVGDVTLLDVVFGYDLGAVNPQLEDLSARVNVQNLTDEFYTASCASAYACFVGSERTVKASIDYRF
ncbi:TonB-dependent siderophore receptor [Cereibacter sphaeroides]|nr:TonB-dependent siderophore receptor [Cereibacter sphaeroides]